MTLQAQTAISEVPVTQKADQIETTSFDGERTGLDVLEQEQQHRASAYGLMAALLRSSPDQSLLDLLGDLAPDRKAGDKDDSLMLAMTTLGLSAGIHSPQTIEDEYHQLFIGLGKGEVVPYGSWYLTGFLMEKPLSDLRDDLAKLGYERNDSVAEPEDHAAALCEVFSMLISEGIDIGQQKHFFQAHMMNWMDRFFIDLTAAKSAIFYKAVARFGSAFLAMENEYFSMQT
ncbi:MAG: TorA maturation chaperone TorD [Gammaproteobacteria bacterium]|jgi:TorA maturation chaperone TorD